MQDKLNNTSEFHFSLIGAGIMSATLGILIKELMPNAKITIYERMDKVASESSNAWNNAGTGHSAYCELNYTPQKEDGTIDITKALKIADQFDVSKIFWRYLMSCGHILSDGSFIQPVDHMSFVWGEENVAFLKKRVDTLIQNHWFEGMEYSEDFDTISTWAPLMMKGRDASQKVAASRMSKGKDVNFGAITKGMIDYLRNQENVKVYLANEIEDVKRGDDDRWELHVKNLETDAEYVNPTDFVFIGAGGAAINILDDSDIPEADGYGGFPVSGKFLKCDNPEIVKSHSVKAYGLAEAGSPPMSVPHLDARMIDGKRTLLFGPFAGFSTKFLKNGSYFDLPMSIDSHNLWPLLVAGYRNLDLTKYLVEQVTLSDEERLEMLQKYYPEAKAEDWELITAGQRVQIIKKDEKEGGKLQFGTEVVTSSDGSLAALLGASPGASTSVSIMIEVLEKCFPSQFGSSEWQNKLTQMIPNHDFTPKTKA